jgi:DNA-binding ferritin-like protein (Dps family)
MTTKETVQDLKDLLLDINAWNEIDIDLFRSGLTALNKRKLVIEEALQLLEKLENTGA